MTALLKAIASRKPGGASACPAGAPCHTRWYDAAEDPARAARCDPLCEVRFEEPVVVAVMRHNAKNMGKLAFLMYHVALAADKRVAAQVAYRRGKQARRAEEDEEGDVEVERGDQELVADDSVMARLTRSVCIESWFLHAVMMLKRIRRVK